MQWLHVFPGDFDAFVWHQLCVQQGLRWRSPDFVLTPGDGHMSECRVWWIRGGMATSAASGLFVLSSDTFLLLSLSLLPSWLSGNLTALGRRHSKWGFECGLAAVSHWCVSQLWSDSCNVRCVPSRLCSCLSTCHMWIVNNIVHLIGCRKSWLRK